MRPLHLRLQAFGSYPGEEVVDFTLFNALSGDASPASLDVTGDTPVIKMNNNTAYTSNPASYYLIAAMDHHDRNEAREWAERLEAAEVPVARVRDLAARTACVADAEVERLTGAESVPARVTCMMADGTRRERFVQYPKGSPRNPMSAAEVHARFRAVAAGVIDAGPAEADAVFYNTCSVRQHAEDKIYSALGRLRGHIEHHPEKVLGVLGCMAQKDQEIILKRAPHVDLVCGTGQLARVPELIDAARSTGRPQMALSLGRKDGSKQEVTSSF